MASTFSKVWDRQVKDVCTTRQACFRIAIDKMSYLSRLNY
jgi:hypothetical protein